MPAITKNEVGIAQKKWADGLVEIGKVFQQDADYQQTAKNLIKELYAYDESDVLFKPTKAAVKPFRDTAEGALSYFIGNSKVFAEDAGFALDPWQKVRFENHGFYYSDDITIAMGEYFFTDQNNQETKVEYTFGYVKDGSGELKIVLHHSSLPFSAS